MSIPRKRDLEILLSRLKATATPKVGLEQYPIPPRVAAELLYVAGFVYNDIVGRRVLDLGTGSGRLAIGAKWLGASEVVAVDIDPEAIEVAFKNAESVGVNVDWVIGNIEAVCGKFDTVVMNPPFGTRRKHLDRVFLSKSMKVAGIVYSLHKRSTRSYLVKLIRSTGGLVEALFEVDMEIPHLYRFHRKRKYVVKVDLYRIRVLSAKH